MEIIYENGMPGVLLTDVTPENLLKARLFLEENSEKRENLMQEEHEIYENTIFGQEEVEAVARDSGAGPMENEAAPTKARGKGKGSRKQKVSKPKEKVKKPKEAKSKNTEIAGDEVELEKELRFNVALDVSLLKEATLIMPTIGSYAEKTRKWKSVKENLKTKFDIGSLHRRLEHLLLKFKEENMQSLRNSGTDEEVEERASLLQDLSDLIRDETIMPSASAKKEKDSDKEIGEKIREDAMRSMKDKSRDNNYVKRKSAVDVIYEMQLKEMELRKEELEYNKQKLELEKQQATSQQQTTLKTRKYTPLEDISVRIKEGCTTHPPPGHLFQMSTLSCDFQSADQP